MIEDDLTETLEALEFDDIGDPQPLPPMHEPPDSFDPDLLPRAFRAYCMDEARRLSCPPEMIAVPLMVAAGAAIGRGLAIRPKPRDNWYEVPNLWGCVVAPPSSMKSPATKAATRSLERIEREWRESHAEEAKKFEAAKCAHEAAMKAAKSKAQQAAAKGKDPASVTMPEAPEPPPERRLLVNAATPEKLIAIHADNPRGLLVLRDELTAWLRGFDRAGREPERAFYLEAWTGKNAFRSDTIGRGSDYLPAACVAVYGGMQPGTFRSYLEAEGDASRADGLLERFSLLIWPERVAYTLNDDPPDRSAFREMEATLRRVVSINRYFSEFGEVDESSEVPFLRFAPEAQAAFLEWLEPFMRRVATVRPESFEGHLSKYRKALPCLALICEVVDYQRPSAVSLQSWRRAERWGAYLETHLRKVYAPAIRADVAGAEKILARLKDGDLGQEFTTRDVHRPQWSGLTDLTVIRSGLNLLEQCHWISGEKTETGGRPSERWCAHRKAVKP